jgi:hypothetical protein
VRVHSAEAEEGLEVREAGLGDRDPVLGARARLVGDELSRTRGASSIRILRMVVMRRPSSSSGPCGTDGEGGARARRQRQPGTVTSGRAGRVSGRW